MSAYLAVLRTGRLGWLELATLVGRLPIGINGLAIVLFFKEETGSFAVAGAVAGGMALGIGGGAGDARHDAEENAGAADESGDDDPGQATGNPANAG